MRYFMFTGGNGYCGCDYEDYEAFEDNITEDEILEISYEKAIDNAETYEYIARQGLDELSDEEIEDEIASYYENIEASYEEISEEFYKEMTGNA